MVLEGARPGAAHQAASLAVLLTEQGLGGPHVDLRERLRRLRGEEGPRARDARALAGRWARDAGGERADSAGVDAGLLLAAAYPERIARARGAAGEFRLASGRGAYLDATEALAREPWLAVGELGGGEARDRILSAAPLDQTDIMAAFADQIETVDEVQTDAAGRVSARRVRRLGRIVIDERRIERPEPALIERALLALVREQGIASLPWGAAAARLRERVAFLRALDGPAWPDLSDAALVARLENWLAPLLAGRASLGGLAAGDLDAAVRALVPWELQRRLDTEAPEAWTAPTGTRCVIDYAAEAGPRIEVRVQELFGLGVQPAVGGGRAPLTLSLLSPARRPIQTTRDLPGFWRGSWAEVRKEMRGRYPKHPWPEDPLAAPPTTRAKPRS
jgi:ATP-dependent helicase HrpB